MLQFKDQSTSVHHQVLWLPTACPSVCVILLYTNGILWLYTVYWLEENIEGFLTLAPSLFNSFSLSIFLSVYPFSVCCPCFCLLCSDFLYVYVCLFIWTCVCARIHVCVCTCSCSCVRTFVHTCVCACAYVCPHACLAGWVCVFLLSGQVRRSCRMMSSPVTFSASCSCSVRDTTQVCVLVCVLYYWLIQWRNMAENQSFG